MSDDLTRTKGILEAALLVAGEPVPVAQLSNEPTVRRVHGHGHGVDEKHVWICQIILYIERRMSLHVADGPVNGPWIIQWRTIHGDGHGCPYHLIQGA